MKIRRFGLTYEVTMFEGSIESAVTRRGPDFYEALLSAHNALMDGDVSAYYGAWSKPSTPMEQVAFKDGFPDFSEGMILIWAYGRLTVVEGVARTIGDEHAHS